MLDRKHHLLSRKTILSFDVRGSLSIPHLPQWLQTTTQYMVFSGIETST